jgi:hypothetical protein
MVDGMDRQFQLRQELHALLGRLSREQDPLDLVADIPIVEEFADDFAHARIADARAAGASWTDIAERLGVTRQAAHKRFTGWRKRGRGLAGIIELRFTRDKNGG